MDTNAPNSGSPVTGGRGKPSLNRNLSKAAITPSADNPFLGDKVTRTSGERGKFIRGLSQLFGFRKKASATAPSSKNIEFVKVDSQSELAINQAKQGRIFKTKLAGKLEELFDSWLSDTTDTFRVLQDRQKRISELEFAIANDPFLSSAADLYADEATQTDVQGKLIEIECADSRMKDRMEQLLTLWGVTQNRLRAVAHHLAVYGDAFWSTKVTAKGVVRINPLSIHQIKERLEFNPIQVESDKALQAGYINSLNRSSNMKTLFDNIESYDNEEFADLFDTKLFGFVLTEEVVVPPWSIVHFRLTPDQSDFFPMGKPIFLKALAPFRMCNATYTLQAMARVMSFPVTVYSVTTHPGMDEQQQFDKVNEIREEYENIGQAGAGSEAYSVNTKLWVPDGLLKLEVQSPDIDISAVQDIEMYQDRVAIASGIPKGYLVQEWGGFGNSAISLVEQFKPFARKVYTVQTAIMEGIANLFRLHFAISGEFDYKIPFVISLKFPNAEVSDQRMAAKNSSLELSKNVLDTVANIVGALNDPLPPEVIQDILTKFSFIDPKDIKKWIKPNPNQVEHEEEKPEEFGDEGGGLGGGGGDFGGGGGSMPGPEGDLDMGGAEGGMDDIGGEEPTESGELGAESEEGGEEPTESGELGKAHEKRSKRLKYLRLEENARLQLRRETMLKRYREAKNLINEAVVKLFSRIDEVATNDRHFKYVAVEQCMIPFLETLKNPQELSKDGKQTFRDSVSEIITDIKKDSTSYRRKLHEKEMAKIRESESHELEDKDDEFYDNQEEDLIRQKSIMDIIS